jgi:hypothetical protein
MATPNDGLITETNRQYYEGAQGFIASGGDFYPTSFNTDLVYFSYNPADPNYALNNFKVFTSSPSNAGAPGTFNEYFGAYDNTSGPNINTLYIPSLANGTYVVVQLKTLDGGNYGLQNAYGNTVENNYGSYAYISLKDVINNFMVAYVGTGKLIGNVKRTDVIFHAKRSLQEFSYDTLRSIKSQELSIPPSLSIVLPQDYVNYVRLSWIDGQGVKHIIYPTNNLTISPYENLIQDSYGIPIQDNFGDNISAESLTERRWKDNNYIEVNEEMQNYYIGYDYYNGYYQNTYYGRQYGLDPQYANINGYFTMNDREGKISFSSNLIGKLIVFEYISDGLAYDLDSKVPKLAEEAIYAYILHAIISTRINQPEYLVARLKQEKNAKLRNAKIRLSNIKLEEFTQVLRGQSKWIKH